VVDHNNINTLQYDVIYRIMQRIMQSSLKMSNSLSSENILYLCEIAVRSGIPDRLMIESDSSGQYSDQFELHWTVRSASPLVETLLRLRSVGTLAT